MKLHFMGQCLIRLYFMGQQAFQSLTASARSALKLLWKQLYRFCLAIALASIILSPGLSLLTTTGAQAGSIGLTGIVEQTKLASKPLHTTAQLPPSLASLLRQALSQQTNIPATTLKVVEATPKTWTNGCLDLARSDEICTQALVKGWRVVFSNGSQRWIYRSDQQGRVYRLEPQGS